MYIGMCELEACHTAASGSGVAVAAVCDARDLMGEVGLAEGLRISCVKSRRMHGNGYSTTQKVVNCANHGDGTYRRRWFLLCLRNKGAIRWPEPRAVFKMAASVLDDPKAICLVRYVPIGEDFVERHPKGRQPPSRSRKLGYYEKFGVADDRALRVYVPLCPLPSATSTMGDKKALQKAVHQSVQIAKLEEATKRKLKADGWATPSRKAPPSAEDRE
jgi:site-specific DNA-cytosine methylase